MLVLGHGEKRGPFGEVVHVKVDVVVLSERVKIREIHFEQVLWLKGTEGSHDSGAYVWESVVVFERFVDCKDFIINEYTCELQTS